MANLAPQIDAYLQKRGSPMAGQGMTFLRAGRKYGVDPRLLVGIATIESGAGAHLAQQYNPFNWGIHRGQKYGSWSESIMDVARGLRRGYLDQGLETPQQIVSKYAPASDNNDEGNWASVVSQVMSQLGGPSSPVPAGAAPRTAAPTQAAPPPPSSQALPQSPLGTPSKVFDPASFASNIRNQFIQGGGRVDIGGIPQTMAASYVAPPPVAPPTTPATEGEAQVAGPTAAQQPVLTGKGILPPLTFKPTHQTSGLGGDAIDIMAKPGTPVRSPVAGTVVYFHPTGAQGGGSMMIRDASGKEYWLGHIANGLAAGTKIGVGTQLAVVSSDHRAPHLHWSPQG